MSECELLNCESLVMATVKGLIQEGFSVQISGFASLEIVQHAVDASPGLPKRFQGAG